MKCKRSREPGKTSSKPRISPAIIPVNLWSPPSSSTSAIAHVSSLWYPRRDIETTRTAKPAHVSIQVSLTPTSSTSSCSPTSLAPAPRSQHTTSYLRTGWATLPTNSKISRTGCDTPTLAILSLSGMLRQRIMRIGYVTALATTSLSI